MILFEDEKLGFEERDLLLGRFFEDETGKLDVITVSSKEGAELRRAIGIPGGRFTVVLVGKDGGEKFRSHEPAPPQDIFGRIDAMPMRRREMRGDSD